MIPSENLRALLEEAYHLPLSDYAWNDDLKHLIFSIKCDPFIEDKVSTLGDAYRFGFNIGHCGTTSRYFSINFDKALMHVGYVDMLCGTKSSTNGGHAWVEYDEYVLDPSLMIFFPVSKKEEFGYHTKNILAKSASCILSEYDTFSFEAASFEQDSESFYNSLFGFNQKTR